jgi:hypothetical protein
MNLKTALKTHKSFSDILTIIIADLQEATAVEVPEILALLRSIDKFATNEKIKAIVEKIIKAIGFAQILTPDVIALLTDLQKILSE